MKSISGGFLAQTPDVHRLSRAETRVEDQARPHGRRMGRAGVRLEGRQAREDQRHRLRATIDGRGQAISAGAGQMSRVDSVKFGAMKAVLPLAGSVVASDAFFPFADGVEEAASHGITAVIQPGGSVRDEDVIAAADRLGLAMVFTGVRHFRH